MKDASLFLEDFLNRSLYHSHIQLNCANDIPLVCPEVRRVPDWNAGKLVVYKNAQRWLLSHIHKHCYCFF